jgi:hypothetical protein
MGEVGDEAFFLVKHLRPDRNLEHCIFAVGAVRHPPTSRPTLPGAQPLIRADAREVAPRSVRDEHDVATLTAVTAIRSAFWDELLTPEVDRAVPASSRNNSQLGAIVKHDAGVRHQRCLTRLF